MKPQKKQQDLDTKIEGKNDNHESDHSSAGWSTPGGARNSEIAKIIGRGSIMGKLPDHNKA